MMHKEYVDDTEQDGNHGHQRRRVLLKDESHDADDKVREQTSGSIPAAKLDRINGKLSGVYENVSTAIDSFATLTMLTSSLVHPHPPRAFASHSLHLALSPRSRDSAVTIPQPHRRQQPRPR